MSYRLSRLAVYAASATLFSPAVMADSSSRADSHAPIGVMADHYHKRGEWMISYRFMSMSMSGNRIGDDSVSPEEIVTSVPNTFFGTPMQPPTLRVVPVDMTMEMQMVGVMYAPTDWLTLMGMASHIDKEMDHVTFAGPIGTTRLGEFTTRAQGLGDTKLSGLLRLYQTDTARLHATLGISLPTGDNDEADQVLTPTGMRPTLRLPYPMQLGSGTYDLLLGLNYSRFYERWSWGGRWASTIRTGSDEGYSLGDEHRLGGWLSYLLRPSVSFSTRIDAYDRSNIDGRDPLIRAPVQTANGRFQGIERVDLSVGINFGGAEEWRGHRLGLEFVAPIDQSLDGPQLETDWVATLGYQYAFE